MSTELVRFSIFNQELNKSEVLKVTSFCGAKIADGIDRAFLQLTVDDRGACAYIQLSKIESMELMFAIENWLCSLGCDYKIWHKPSDKLPERNYINTQYLVTNVTSDVFILQWDSDRNHWYGKDGQIYKVNEISYWTLICPPEC
jgi:hypothetical protein